MAEPSTNLYLEQEVLNASPAKLRWLLIARGVQLCRVIAELWRAGDHALGDQWSLRLHDVLNELLSGVHGKDPISAQVADLYVFMLKQLTQAEQAHSLPQLGQLQELLEIEAETWLLVQQDLAGHRSTAPISSAAQTSAAPHLGTPRPGSPGAPFFQQLQHDAAAAIDGSLCIDA